MGNNIILGKFDEWVSGLGELKARITVFEHIRDIPYYLVPQISDPYEWATSMIRANEGSCSPKHYLLGFLFEKLGITVKYMTYPFKWDKQPIKYTDELMRLAHGCPVGYHTACKAFIDGKWILVDATWDMALEIAGFPVNQDWDGASPTLNAVVPFDEVAHESLQGRLDFVKDKRLLFTEEQKVSYALFIEKFNTWLENLRSPIL